MIGKLQTQKFKYLFSIIDFDQDGAIKEDDFVSLAENITIFRCMPEGSVIENSILQKGSIIWDTMNFFFEKKYYIIVISMTGSPLWIDSPQK